MVTRFKRFFGQDAGFVAKVLGLSLVLHLVAAIFSLGQHSADEHFQILEFLNFKLGLTPQSVLAIEYAERMRPWFQPGFYFLIAKLLGGFGISNPFHWAFAFRLVSGLLGWASLIALAACVRDWFANSRVLRRFTWGMLGLLWYLPALHARTSSENFSGSFFVLGMALLVLLLGLTQARGSRWTRGAFLAGTLLGFSFESRFQSGVMIFGLGAWLLILARISWRALLPILLGFFGAFALGRLIDFWGYGEWVMSPWNYVDYNLIRGEVNRYHQSPWWDVFRMAFTESWPILGFLVVVLGVAGWIRNPTHVLTWSFLPFFAIHCLIAHKELRFFFPIASGVMPLIALGLSENGLMRLRRGIWNWGYRVLILLNFAGLMALCTQPFSRVIYFQKGMMDAVPSEMHGKERSLNLWTEGKDPYEILGTDTYFYRAREFAVERAPIAQLERDAMDLGPNDFIFAQSFQFPETTPSLKARCRREFTSLPEWVTHFNFNDWLSRTSIWSLWRCGQ